MAAMAKMEITLDPETKAAIEALTDQVKALRDLLETKAGTENHYHYHYPQQSYPYNPMITWASNG